MDDNTLPISGLEDLEKHLQLLIDFPDTPLDVKLFDTVELQLTEANTPPLIPRLLPNLTELLSNYQQDPAVIVSLAIKLLRPIRFTDALQLASEESLIRALESPAPSANILAMTVISKASRAPSDTAILSIMKGVVSALIRTWLSSPSVEVGEKATKTLGDLLEVDCDHASAANLNMHMNGLQITPGRPPGQGLLWRRIFHDRDIYALVFDLCSHATVATGPPGLDARQKSLAQARLLRLLPKLSALDLATVSRSGFPDVAASLGQAHGDRGLLYFAAVQMVDKEDVLMHITLMDFFAEFLDAVSAVEVSGSAMRYLGALMRTVTEGDAAMYKSLESLAGSPNSSPELVELLVRLNSSNA